VGAIKSAPTTDLDKRVNELIKQRDEVDKATQDELDFIYAIVAKRNVGLGLADCDHLFRDRICVRCGVEE